MRSILPGALVPFRRFVKRCLIALLNRSPLTRNVAADLKPFQEVLQAQPGGVFKLRSTGVDPQFVADNELVVPGWYMVEVQVETDVPGAVAKIYFDTGHGFDENGSCSFPLRNGALTKRLVRVPLNVHKIRFDPVDGEGSFTLHRLRFVWAPWSFASRRIFQRIANVHPGFKGLSVSQVEGQLRHLPRDVSGQSRMEQIAEFYEQTFVRLQSGHDYQKWLSERAEWTQAERDQVLSLLAYKPLISILMPVYNPAVDFLELAIASVQRQTYSSWQLCIANDASTNTVVADVLDRYARADRRISVIHRTENGHISAASNSALSLARGDFVALLDQDDELAPDALLKVVSAINKNPGSYLIYSDEDKIDERGNRFDPHFKPGWNPELLLGQNYISHLGVYRADRVQDIGGFREGFEGSQDHDLVLRFTSGLDAGQIVHIPEVLYHWRAVEGSTAMGSGEKAYTSAAGLRAVTDAVAGIPGARAVAGQLPNTYRIKYALPGQPPRVSLLIPTRDGVDILKPCVDALLKRTDYPNFEVLILDNQSSCSETLAYMEEVSADTRVKVLRWDHPFNYSAINNFGARHAEGDILGLVNNDIEPINPEWLSEMVSHVIRDSVGCVGAKLYYPNNTIQHAGVILGIGGVAGHSHKYFDRYADGYFSRLKLVQNVSAVTGACLLIRKDVFKAVGGLDEENLAVAFNDVDLCLRVRDLGYLNVWTPYAEAYHHESVSRGADDTPEKRDRHNREAGYMRERWGSALLLDPAYNVNLTLIHEDFSLRQL